MNVTGLQTPVARIIAAAAFLAAVIPLGALGQDGPRTLAQSYNAAGQELFSQFPASPGNVVFSPYSIGTAMAMVLAGARGDTEREMATVLKQRLGRDAINAANARVLATLNGYDNSAASQTCPPGTPPNDRRCESPPSAKLAVANALMLTRGNGAIAPDYVALLKDNYAAEIFQNATLADVNDWVNRKTQGKIERILDKLDPATAAVILNAVYFKAKWASVFSKDRTKDEPFNLARDRTATVPTMRNIGTYALVTRKAYRAIRLPYDVNALGMVIVLPDEIEGLNEVSGRLDSNELSQLFVALRQPAADKRVDLALPRFKAEYLTDLAALFKQAGMTRAFDLAKADFSGMTGRPPSDLQLAIDQIVHRAMIDVMEDGTEAAAATAVTMVLRSAQPAPLLPEPFHVDRPFLFYVVDNETGAILFQGRITDPKRVASVD